MEEQDGDRLSCLSLAPPAVIIDLIQISSDESNKWFFWKKHVCMLNF